MSETDFSRTAEPIAWADIDRMRFPTWFTATIDYFATGEGQTVWIVMAFAGSADDLRATVLRNSDAYCAEGALVWPRLVVPAVLKNFVPAAVAELCELPDNQVGHFEFSSRFHRNLA